MSLNQSPVRGDAPKTTEEVMPVEVKKAARLPGWAKLLPGILIAAALFIFLFLLVLGGPGADADPTPSGSTAPSDTGTLITDAGVLPEAPADGNPEDITCLGSYTAENGMDFTATVVATAGDAALTNAQLQVYYWQEVYSYLSENSDHVINLDHGLDVQMCTVSDTPMTWQQYFLQRAIDTWHVYQALALTSDAQEYGLDQSYRDYLDSLPQLLEQTAAQMGFADAGVMITALAGAGVTVEDYTHYVRLYEEGHIYFDRVYQNTTPTSAEVSGYYLANSDAYDDISGKYVDIRHILLVPESDTPDDWEDCLIQAQTIRYLYNRDISEATFAQLAFEHSADTGSNFNGGLYTDVYDGMFIDEINEWCFDSSRKSGTTTIIKSEIGYHVLYFKGSREARLAAAEKDLIGTKVSMLVPAAMETYPAEINYRAIKIADAALSGLDTGGISERVMVLQELCQAFPDAAYQRFATVPLYIQQDYPHINYGGTGDTIYSHGCGICALTMAATYLTDTEHTVENVTDQFRHYGTPVGSSWTLLDDAPSILGFYSDGRVSTWEEALTALEEGKLVVSLQRKGPFTTGGHYILLYGVTEDGRILVRDSDLVNHSTDFADTDYFENGFPAEMVYRYNHIFWVLGPKVTQIPACVRCGDTEPERSVTSFLLDTYTCPKCATALHLRQVYDTACDIDPLDTIVPPVSEDTVIDETQPESTGDTLPPDSDAGTKPDA